MARFERIRDRVGAFSGLIFAVIYFVSIIFADPFAGSIEIGPNDDASTFRTVLTRNSDTVERGVYIALISIFFLFAFVAYLRQQLRLIDQPSGWLPSMAFAGGIAACGALLLEAYSYMATTVVSDYGSDWQVAKSVAVFAWATGEVQGPAFATLTVATGLIMIRLASAWKAFGWISIGVGLIILLYTPGAGLALFLTWILLLSVILAFGIKVSDMPEDSLGRAAERLGISIDRE